MTNNGREI